MPGWPGEHFRYLTVFGIALIALCTAIIYKQTVRVPPIDYEDPDDAFSHPRGAGTFTRFLAQYVRDRKLISWPDAIAKTSYLPAKLPEETAPHLRKKGRLQVGMDADIVVFDPATVQDRATYERPNQTSAGMRCVLVNGVYVIRDGELDKEVFPGRPMRRTVSP